MTEGEQVTKVITQTKYQPHNRWGGIFDSIGEPITQAETLSNSLLMTLKNTETCDDNMLEFVPLTAEKAEAFVSKYSGEHLRYNLQTYLNTLCSRVTTIAYEGAHGVRKTTHAVDLANEHNAPLVKLAGYIQREEFDLYGIKGQLEDVFGKHLIDTAQDKDGDASWRFLQQIYIVKIEEALRNGQDLILADRGPVTRMFNWFKYERTPNQNPFEVEFFHPQLNYGKFSQRENISPFDFRVTMPIPHVVYILNQPRADLDIKKAKSNQENTYSYRNLAMDMMDLLSPYGKMELVKA